MAESELPEVTGLADTSGPAPTVPELVVPNAEYADRLRRVRARLAERGLDGILVVDPANIYYLSGYNAWSFYTPQALYVGIDDTLVLMQREMDALGAHRTLDVVVEHVIGYPDTLVHHPDEHPMAWCAAQLRHLGLVGSDRTRIAYEGDAHFFSPRAFRTFAEGLGAGAEFVESRELVNWERVVKSPVELEHMRRAGRIATSAMRAGIDAVQAGASQSELAAVIMAQQARGVADDQGIAVGDYPAIVPMFPVGEGADTPHLTWTGALLRPDEPISIELAGVFRRYHAPLARTVSVGKPGPDLDRLAKVTVEGLNAALDAMRPGNTPAHVIAEWNAVLARHGLQKRSRLGYSIGIGYPPDWGERTVSLRGDDETELRENMTFHVIAGMWMTGYGFELSESVRVADGGPEVFTDVPRRLIVKEAT